MPVIQLYCLQCNRPNDAESRFCGGCGAGLIRKFCPRCHAINAADSHFCQACGAPLPLPPGASEPPSDDLIPNLTDTVEMPLARAAAPTAIVPMWVSPAGSLPAVKLPIVATTVPPAPPANELPRLPRGLLSPHRLALGVLGIGAVLALVAAVTLRAGSSDPGRSVADSARPALAGVARQRTEALSEVGAVVPMRDTRATTAGHSETTARKPLVDGPVAAGDGVEAALAQAEKALGSTAAAPRTAGALAATAAPAAMARVRPDKPVARPAPAARPPECTPEVDALGLCAAGARITGRP